MSQSPCTITLEVSGLDRVERVVAFINRHVRWFFWLRWNWTQNAFCWLICRAFVRVHCPFRKK